MIIAIFYAGRTVPKKAGWCGSVEEEGRGGGGVGKSVKMPYFKYFSHILRTTYMCYEGGG